jgi:hypothetical protein
MGMTQISTLYWFLNMEDYQHFQKVHQKTLQLIKEQGFDKGFEFYQDNRQQYQDLSNRAGGRNILLKSLIEILSEGEKLHANQGLSVLPKTDEQLSTTPELLEHCIGVIYSITQLDKHPNRIHYIYPIAA